MARYMKLALTALALPVATFALLALVLLDEREQAPLDDDVEDVAIPHRDRLAAAYAYN